MNLNLDLRYVILTAFLIGIMLSAVPALPGKLYVSNQVVVCSILGGLFQLIGAFAGLMDLKQIKASGADQVLWMLFFVSLSVVAFPAYLYKRFRGNASTPRQRYEQFDQKIRKRYV